MEEQTRQSKQPNIQSALMEEEQVLNAERSELESGEPEDNPEENVEENSEKSAAVDFVFEGETSKPREKGKEEKEEEDKSSPWKAIDFSFLRERFAGSEMDEDSIPRMQKMCEKAGLTQAQAESVFSDLLLAYQEGRKEETKETKGMKETKEESSEGREKEKEDVMDPVFLEKTLPYARYALNQVVEGAEKEMVVKRFGEDKLFLTLLSKMGQRLAPTPLVKGERGEWMTESQQAARQLESLKRQPDFETKYLDPFHPGHEKLIDEMDRLGRLASGVRG